MPAPNYARRERASLCDLLTALGPDEPTLCAGWRTRDLAAHLVMRERRPDAAAGILLRPLAGRTTRVQSALAARPFDELVAMLREPPRWSLSGVGAVDRAVNTLEFFVHHEDVRRAQPGWQPRDLPDGQARALWRSVRPLGRRAMRGFPVAVLVVAPGYGRVRAGSSGPQLWLTGDPGELAIFLTGRQAESRAEVAGSDDLAERLRRTRLGI